MYSVFIDGQAGTTGLQITSRLASHAEVSLLTLSDDDRKHPERRREALHAADVAILCLPDDAAKEAVSLAAGETRIIDASTAHRVDPDWVYGVPELSPEQRERITSARLVSNPGCYPQGFILLVRPLIQAGFLDADTRLRCHAVSGYSGGGRQMIEAREAMTTDEAAARAAEVYALTLSHKHVPEMHHYSSAERAPLFSPSVAHYYSGMLVQVPLFVDELRGQTPEQVHALLAETYADERFVEVLPTDPQAIAPDGFLNPTALNGTNRLQLMVLGNATQMLLVARYDNLGKGAAGAAVQNLNLMLGLKEGAGLD